MEIRVFFGRTMIVADNQFYDVEPYYAETKLNKDTAYMLGEYVYVYRGKVDKIKDKMKAGIYLYEGKHHFVEPKSEHDKQEYHISRITDLDISTIMTKVSKNHEKFVSQEDIEYVNNNSDILKVVINDSDDFLKVAIKKAINDKGISLSNYKNKQDSQWGLLNLKGALIKGTKMTVVRFNDWAEILGLRWTLILEDNGTDTNRPLKEPIVIESEDFL